METQNPVYAIIVAGGQGTRMGTAIPKQFLELNGKPVLYHTVNAFVEAISGIQIILVLPAHQISYAQMVLHSFHERIDVTIVAGGETRFQSVKNGLNAIDKKELAIAKDAIIFVQDGVRPLVGIELIKRCYEQALLNGSAIPAIPLADSVRIVTNEHSEAIDRSKLRIIQTPQTFKASILMPAMELPFRDNFTDEATVVETYGHHVHLVEGERTNIKITTPEDLLVAEAFLKASGAA